MYPTSFEVEETMQHLLTYGTNVSSIPQFMIPKDVMIWYFNMNSHTIYRFWIIYIKKKKSMTLDQPRIKSYIFLENT